MQQVDDIKKDLRIAIYGAGEAGLLIKRYIDEKRPDLKLTCFFDKVEKAEIDGVAVCSIKTIDALKNSFDLVIVASCSNIGIMETILRNYGVENYLHLDDFFLSQAEDYSQDCLSANDVDKIAEVQNILSSAESKKIFELIVDAYNCKHCLKKLSEYLKMQNKQIHPQLHDQYLDFIDADSIKTVISGGAYDAGTALLFLDRFKNLEKLYAFEPLYDKFKCEVNDAIVSKSGKVEIVKKGLFDKTGVSCFVENDYASTINNAEIYDLSQSIKTVSIDDFVKENNIKKIDFIKMDVEGCEMAALIGAERTIKGHRPQLAICIYHSYQELFTIPLYLKNLLENYKFEVYHYSLSTIWESVVYAIPNEIYKQDKTPSNS